MNKGGSEDEGKGLLFSFGIGVPCRLRRHRPHDLSADIKVPDVHIKEKRVNLTFLGMVDGGRDSYFWIDDRDLRSKKIFSFLMFVFTLVETGEKGVAPVVTIPTG